MTFTSTTIRKLRALGLEETVFDAVLAIFEDAQQSKPKKKGCASDREDRGTRLPDDWALPADWSIWALQIGLRPNEIDRERTKFKNYWLNQPGPKGVKIKWFLTWQNWVISTLERAGRAPNPEAGAPIVLAGPEAFDDKTWAVISARYKKTGEWKVDQWGPPPGRMDCQMPEAYL